MGTIVGLPALVPESMPLEEILTDVVQATTETAVKDGAVEPCLIVVGQAGNVSVDDVPNGHTEMAKFFTDKVEEYKSAKAYIFVTESWTLEISTDDVNEINKYVNNPDSIAENPFKEERLTFHAANADEELEGYVKVTRDDGGGVIIGNTVIERAKEHFSNVADLLIPMVK